ncbi:MAG: hypothetical protein KAQ90_04165, partial [Melioribacteraceae bacterium]|nr:hypothetical protein [Melioribacteraceae bacterium]
KFGSQGKFAKAVGYSEGQISRAIKTQSPKFIVACKKAGIDINEIVTNEKGGSAIEEVKLLKKRIEELERIVELQKELLENYKELLSKKE